jgi:hypothetical protein
MLVERGDALASDKLTGAGIVLGGDQGGERLQVNLLVEVGEFAAQEGDDAVGANGMDAGKQDEAAVAVRAAQPGQVADVGRSRLGKIRATTLPRRCLWWRGWLADVDRPAPRRGRLPGVCVRLACPLLLPRAGRRR